MPTYTVRDPTTNRTLYLTGDRPPTKEKLDSIFSTYEWDKPIAPNVDSALSSGDIDAAPSSEWEWVPDDDYTGLPKDLLVGLARDCFLVVLVLQK